MNSKPLRVLVTILLLAISLTAGSAAAIADDQVAQVVFVSGEVRVADQPVRAGQSVTTGAAIVTGSGGYLYLKTFDGGFFILRPNSVGRIISYQVDTQNPANTRIKLELQKGVARHVSGDAVKQARQNFRFNTPVAAIGVRGTDFAVYADADSTRVAVLSGGVIVSGFGGVCAPAGQGPCEGEQARELFASQAGQVLHVTRNQPVPQLSRDKGLSPDAVQSPRNDEPAAARDKIGELPLDVRRQENFIQLARQESAQQVPLAAVSPVLASPRPSELIWGRWQAIADQPVDAEMIARAGSGTHDAALSLGAHFIARLKDSEFTMPRDGRAVFNLAASDAYLQKEGRAPVAASLRNPQLEIDFASRAFITRLDVVGGGMQADVRAQGTVTRQGELISDITRSNAQVTGYLGQADAREAAYLFKTTDAPEVAAFGATRWSR